MQATVRGNTFRDGRWCPCVDVRDDVGGKFTVVFDPRDRRIVEGYRSVSGTRKGKYIRQKHAIHPTHFDAVVRLAREACDDAVCRKAIEAMNR